MKNKIINKLKNVSWYTLALIIIFIVAGPEAYIGLELFSLLELLGASTFALAYLLMFKMFIERLTDEVKKVLMLCIIIAALPFAFELALFVEVAGVETAYACLLIMLAPITSLVIVFVERCKSELDKIFNTAKQHPVFKTNVYISHALIGSFVIVFTGSLFLSTIVWIPVLMLGDSIV